VDLDELPVSSFRGVGDAVAGKLAGLGIRSAQDVLFHLPHRYEDRTRLTPIGALQPGVEAVVSGEIVIADVVMRRRRSLLVRIGDGTGSLVLRFFHFGQAQVRQFERGARLQCFGEARRGPGVLEMVHPEYRLLKSGESAGVLEQTLTPIYPTTTGISQAMLRRLTDQALGKLQTQVPVDWLPCKLIAQAVGQAVGQDVGQDDGQATSQAILPVGSSVASPAWPLPALPEALTIVHRPPADASVDALTSGLHPAHRRLALEELVAHRLGLRLLREQAQRRLAPQIPQSGQTGRQLRAALDFTPTAAQERVLVEIGDDLIREQPMLRLVQGDVGAGKTVVAALAAADVVDAGHQVALMAPTEILAEQHLLTFSAWFEPLGVEIAYLTGKLSVGQRRACLGAVASGRARIVVGTHALFQSQVEFHQLGLAIIDEQHRFGVHQRMALRDKGTVTESADDAPAQPHQLIMTATPIPRTLAMTAFADLDVSVIDELPPGRKPVTTVALDNARRRNVIERVSVALATGQQVYWVCTLIEDSDQLQAAAAEESHAALREQLPGRRVGLIHGRMKARDKEALMQGFKAQQIDVLVATTVIEVGVDVPNASLMIIENAERLGLSQLHQLRGRVGRGSAQSACVLLYQSPLPEQARARIGIMRETNDGFLIAEKDLELRGAGEVLGTRQTGAAEFRIAALGRDDDLLDSVVLLADHLLAHAPGSVHGLLRRWIGEQRADYGGV